MFMSKTNKSHKLAVIQPFKLNDKKTGNIIEVKRTPNYSILLINERSFYFDLKTGEFDGVSADINQGN